MPSPARTSRDQIVAAARAIVDEGGLEALTMERVAVAVGVRGPSLYKRVRDRAQLIHLVANAVAAEVGDLVEEAATSGDPRRDLRAMVDVLRAYARDQPSSYGLLFGRLPQAWRADDSLLQRTADPLIRVVASLAGSEHALEAARTAVAWARGFIDMELAGAFRLGGDVEAAYEYGIGRITDAIDVRTGQVADIA